MPTVTGHSNSAISPSAPICSTGGGKIASVRVPGLARDPHPAGKHSKFEDLIGQNHLLFVPIF